MITLNRDLHNHLVWSTDLWRALSAPSVLLFQCDAALCPNPSRSLSMVKVQSGQCPGSARVPPQGVPDGSGRFGTSRERLGLWAPSH